MKLNKKGSLELAYLILTGVGILTVHFVKYNSGEWGKNGTKAINNREYATCDFTGAHVCNIDELAFANYKEKN